MTCLSASGALRATTTTAPKFYLGAQAAVNFEIIVLAFGSLLNLLREHRNPSSPWSALIITLLAALSLVRGLSSKAAPRNDLYRRFANSER